MPPIFDPFENEQMPDIQSCIVSDKMERKSKVSRGVREEEDEEAVSLAANFTHKRAIEDIISIAPHETTKPLRMMTAAVLTVSDHHAIERSVQTILKSREMKALAEAITPLFKKIEKENPLMTLQAKLTKVMEELTGTKLSELEVRHHELENFKRLGFKEPLSGMRCVMLERAFPSKLQRASIMRGEFEQICSAMEGNIKPSPPE